MFTLVFLVDDENGVYGYPESCAHNIESQLIYANGAAILDPIDVAIMQGLNVKTLEDYNRPDQFYRNAKKYIRYCLIKSK